MLDDVEACFTSFKFFVGLMHNFTHYDRQLLVCSIQVIPKGLSYLVKYEKENIFLLFQLKLKSLGYSLHFRSTCPVRLWETLYFTLDLA